MGVSTSVSTAPVGGVSNQWMPSPMANFWSGMMGGGGGMGMGGGMMGYGMGGGMGMMGGGGGGMSMRMAEGLDLI